MEKLNNQRIVITRSQDDFPAAVEAVRRRGGIPISCPMIELLDPLDCSDLDCAINSLRNFNWIFFTSAHSVDFFVKRMVALSIDKPETLIKHTAVIGSATAQALAAYGLQADFVARNSTGVDFFEEFQVKYTVRGSKFLLPLSDIARDSLTNLLRENGGEVTAVTAYRNKAVDDYPDGMLEYFIRKKIDWVLFFSSSAASNFARVMRRYPSITVNFKVASIGPLTSKTLRDNGIEPVVEAKPYSLEGLLDAISLI